MYLYNHLHLLNYFHFLMRDISLFRLFHSNGCGPEWLHRPDGSL